MKALLLSASVLFLCCACDRHSREEAAPFNEHYGPAGADTPAAGHTAPDHAVPEHTAPVEEPVKSPAGH